MSIDVATLPTNAQGQLQLRMSVSDAGVIQLGIGLTPFSDEDMPLEKQAMLLNLAKGLAIAIERNRSVFYTLAEEAAGELGEDNYTTFKEVQDNITMQKAKEIQEALKEEKKPMRIASVNGKLVPGYENEEWPQHS